MAYTVDVQHSSLFHVNDARVAVAANQALACECFGGAAHRAARMTLTRAESPLPWRGSATDVLSFPAGEPMPGSEDLLEYLGDIAIFCAVRGKAGGHEGARGRS